MKPIFARLFCTKGDSNILDKPVLLEVGSSVPIIGRLSEVCIPIFKGGSIKNISLCRPSLTYIHKGRAIKFDRRTWAFVKIDCDICVGGKNYTSVCCPLFGISALLKLKSSDSNLLKEKVYSIMKVLNIQLIKPKVGLKTFAGLLTGHQVSLIMQHSSFDFDLSNYNAFRSQFKSQVEKLYGETCLAMFVFDQSILTSDLNDNQVATILQEDKLATDSLPLDSTCVSEIVSSGHSHASNETSPFSQENVVYCIRYEEYPGYFRTGAVYKQTLAERCKQHAYTTSLNPIVVFAFEQKRNFTEIHPEQLELDLQQTIARDLLNSGFLEVFDLGYVRHCGDFGFFYNGSSADLTRVCFSNSTKFFLNNFEALDTKTIIAGNKFFKL